MSHAGAQFGGAVYIGGGGGAFASTNDTFVGNAATQGGAIGLYNGGSAVVVNGSFSANAASQARGSEPFLCL